MLPTRGEGGGKCVLMRSVVIREVKLRANSQFAWDADGWLGSSRKSKLKSTKITYKTKFQLCHGRCGGEDLQIFSCEVRP